MDKNSLKFFVPQEIHTQHIANNTRYYHYLSEIKKK